MSDPVVLINNTGRSYPAVPLPPVAPAIATGPNAEPVPSFKAVLMEQLEQVNGLQQEAEMAIEDLVAGRRDDVDRVLIAKQKADLAFQMLLQVRNKLSDAYDEIKQMRV